MHVQDSTTRPWAWAEDPRAVMWCVTFTRGITPEDVLARYGADARAAQFLTRQQAGRLNDSSLAEGSVLRVGALGAWSFCFEDYGVMGAMPGPLSALSQGRETFSVLRGGDGTNGFAHWRDGQCTERFEPGFTHTKPKPPHPWWDAVQERLDATGEEYPGLVPLLEAVVHHTGAVLDTGTLSGPLLTLRLEDSSRTPDPPPPHPRSSRPPGRILGRPALPGTPPPPAVGRTPNAPITPQTHGAETEK
ncbi:DUF6461 domain-containing protein [Streptomyces sp. NPDC052079]|uniref:DUF6461 domain-containing protein n=1 Tax=Streptomyces sp. NPDC052079 TaxID=3155526 RepID=UPI00341E30F9